VEEEVSFKIGGKEYPVPDLTFRQYRKTLKVMDDIEKKRTEEPQSELEQLEEVQELYFNLLKYENPDITKKMLEDMPLYQYSMEFFVKVKLALFQAPLEKPKVKK